MKNDKKMMFTCFLLANISWITFLAMIIFIYGYEINIQRLINDILGISAKVLELLNYLFIEVILDWLSNVNK